MLPGLHCKIRQNSALVGKIERKIYMIKVLFICHGNICRSPMAEFVMKDIVSREGAEEQFLIASAATSSEEIGNPVHHGTRNKLKQLGISTQGKYAVKMTREDYDKYNYLIGMEEYNIRNMKRIAGEDGEGKMFRLLDFTKQPRDIADPWYTGNFDLTYEEIKEGCEAFFSYINDLREGQKLCR